MSTISGRQVIDSLEIPPDQLKEFRELLATWENGNRKDVRDEMVDHGDDLPWLMTFGAYFLVRLGVAEYAILFRLVDAWTTERKRAAKPATINDCKTRFRFRWPNTGVHVNATYDHLGGRLALELEPGDRQSATKDEWVIAYSACQDLEGNYFSMRDVRSCLREAGVPDDAFPSY